MLSHPYRALAEAAVDTLIAAVARPADPGLLQVLLPFDVVTAENLTRPNGSGRAWGVLSSAWRSSSPRSAVPLRIASNRRTATAGGPSAVTTASLIPIEPPSESGA